MSWIRRRWWELRQGHSTYLVLLLTFSNFVLIAYRLLVEKIPEFQVIFPDLLTFMFAFLGFYIPLSILIGYWHRKTQLKTETTMMMQQNPYFAKMFRNMLDVQTGVATPQQIADFRTFLLEIEK